VGNIIVPILTFLGGALVTSMGWLLAMNSRQATQGLRLNNIEKDSARPHTILPECSEKFADNAQGIALITQRLGSISDQIKELRAEVKEGHVNT